MKLVANILIKLIAVVVVLVLILFFSSCKKEVSASKLQPIRFALLNPGIGTAYLEFAKDHGLFAREGIDFKPLYFLQGGSEANSAIASGQVDAGSYGSPILTAIIRGLKIKIIAATSDTINKGSILVARPGINSVEELRGKIVGTTTKGQGPYQQVFAILNHHGITANDVKLMPAYGSTNLALLKSGQIDATTLGELDLKVAVKNGFAHPLDTSGKYLGSYQSGFVFASDNLLKNNFPVAQKLQTALVKANALALDSFPAFSKFVYQKYGKSYDSLELVSYLHENLTQKNKSFTVFPHAVRNYLNLMVKWGDLTQKEVDSFTDDRLFDLRIVTKK